MNKVFPIALIIALSYVGYVVRRNHREDTTTGAGTTESVEGASTSAPAGVTPPESARNRLPEGTYFLVQRVSVMTDAGVVGELPGTKVTLVAAGPPMRVSDGQNEFEVAPEQITNDLDVATRVFYSDQAARIASAARSAREVQEVSRKQEADLKALASQQQSHPAGAATPTPPSAAQPPAASIGTLDQAAHLVNPYGPIITGRGRSIR